MMNKFYTHILVKYPLGTNVIINDEGLKKLDIKLESHKENIFFCCISGDIKLTERGFENLREKFVDKLNETNCYTSILYDSISAQRHKDISDSIYSLEREFRGLIEIFMLKTRGSKWTEIAAFESVLKKSKKDNREAFIQLLKNPLDDLDFITLKSFVDKHICIDNNRTIVNKLDIIKNRLDSIESSGDEGFEQVIKDITEIKENCVTKKDKELSSDRLYKHLNTTISEEWKRLYSLRNLWAHNNCIITSKEFDEYNKLSENVFYKLRTEMSILTFFESDEEEYYIINEDDIKMRVNKYKLRGIDNCKFTFIKTNKISSIIIQKDLFTYVDLFRIMKKFSTNEEEILIYEQNPIIFKHNIEDSLVKAIKESSLEDTKEKFNELNEVDISDKFSIKEEKGNTCILAGKVDEYLSQIFDKKKI